MMRMGAAEEGGISGREGKRLNYKAVRERSGKDGRTETEAYWEVKGREERARTHKTMERQ